ncbi:hypothetical protein YC2023_020475 [Brassica napus]
MEDHPHDESFDLQEIHSRVKELEYLHHNCIDESGESIPCGFKALAQDYALQLETKVKEIVEDYCHVDSMDVEESVNLVMDKVANRPRRFAFLRYETEEQSMKAIQGMHGKVEDNKKTCDTRRHGNRHKKISLELRLTRDQYYALAFRFLYNSDQYYALAFRFLYNNDQYCDCIIWGGQHVNISHFYYKTSFFSHFGSNHLFPYLTFCFFL